MIEEIINRRSIRKFIEKEVTRENIMKILESARLAPSAHNRQPWHFIVLNHNQKNKVARMMLDKVDQNSNIDVSVINTANIIENSDKLILVFLTDITDDKLRRDMNEQSIGAAIENMCLQATNMGIGSLWIGNIHVVREELEKLYKQDSQLTAALALGYPDQTPNQRPRKDLEEIVTWMEENK